RFRQGRRQARSRRSECADHAGARTLVRGRYRESRRVGAGVTATQESSKAATTLFDDGTGTAGSQRRCVATGRIDERSSLLRFVVSPGGELVPDVAARL